MHILLIHQYFLEKTDPGGSRFNEMTKVWEEKGHKTTVLAGMVGHFTGKMLPHYKGKLTYVDYHSPNVKVIRCFIPESYVSGYGGRFLGYIVFVLSSIYAGLFKAKEKYDIIIVTSPPLFVGIPGWLLSKIKRIPFIFEVRDLWPESATDTGVLTNKWIIKFASWFEKFLYRKAKLINVLTLAFKENLITLKGVPEKKVVYIPNAADFSYADQLASEFDIANFRKMHGWDGKTIITYVGAHGVANHLIQVIETAELLKNRKDVLFLCIGEGMQRPMLQKEAAQRKLDNIRFLGPVPKSEVFKYILASDIGASVLKKVDTFKTVLSNKTFDYMSCKKPILMVIDGVSRQLVEEADAGIFVEPENPVDFADKVVKYLDMPRTEWQRQGESGYRYAKNHFDRQILAQKYLQIISEIVYRG
jgi:glycosyltransferase involved in cell wall biosynthesis